MKSQFPSAVLGSDGRYHLVGGARCCTPVLAEFDHCASVTYWLRRSKGWTSRQAPDVRRGWIQEWWDVTWRVELVGGEVDPAAVPKRERCPNVRGVWPAGATPNSRRAEDIVRGALLQEFGRACSICCVRWGQYVDHDHFTGIVRGLLCHDCNLQVDRCLHLSGCPFAEYLNSPPAAHLNLRYPRHRARMQSIKHRERIQLMLEHGLPAPLGC
ncbi:endonuclease domain-containing protein [Acidipropionibacterium jensenii]|uniref:endonuclease domain-containing protein n=1 Tax=Acidipropionibacterium jensenii TaxID=1749 RepID=UPI003452C755